MNNSGWFKQTATALTGSYDERKFEFNAKHIKLKTDNTCTFSFDGKDDHGTVVAADGLVNFQDVNKSSIFVKGTGAITIIAWDGN